MDQKTIGIIVMFLVLSVGVISVLKMTDDTTGAPIVEPRGSRENKYCCCHMERYDFRGNIIGTIDRKIRIRGAEAWNDDSCNMRCDIMLGAKYNDATGYAC